MTHKNLTKNEFLQLSAAQISELVKKLGKPKVGVFMPDGSRRSAIFFLGLKPGDNDFEKKYIKVNGKKFLDDVKLIFQHGLNTLMVPTLKHENFDRDKKTVDAIIEYAIKSILVSKEWLDFYDEYKIKVTVYGDYEYIKSKGYPEVIDWIKEVEDLTKNNTKHKLFHGIACSNRYEHLRLMDLAIDFYHKHKRKPTEKEKIQLYYRDVVDDVDFLIRATEIRDSDLQPPIISGKRTQMYFLVAPDFISFSEDVYKNILYDLLYCRSQVLGRKMYQRKDLENINLNYIKNYYLNNRSEVVGLGEKFGPFWVPEINIIMPEKD
jgi:undecaprenyl diphosphate synthase